VFCPDVHPRVEERAELSGLRIEGGEVTSLVSVTTPAGERQVIDVGCAAVLPCYYMIYLVREEGYFG
jgi:hypothetical protein